MTAEKIKLHLRDWNFPTQIILLSLPHTEIQSSFKYLPILFWAVLFCSFSFKEVLTGIKKNKLFYIYLMSLFISSTLHSGYDLLKATLLLLSTSLYLNTKTISHKQAKLVMSLVFACCLIPIFNSQNFFTSIFSHHNTFALVIIFGIHLINVSNFSTSQKLIGYLLFSYPLFLTKSRSALVFMITYGFLSIVFHLKLSLKLKKALSLLTFLICLVFYFAILANAHTLNRYLNNSPKIHMGKTIFGLSGRDNLYNASIKIIGKAPLGVGSKESTKVFKRIEQVNTPHNLFLKIAVDYGVISLVIYFSLFLYILKSNNNPYFLSFFLAYHVKLLFDAALPFGLSLSSALVLYPPLFHLRPPFKDNNC